MLRYALPALALAGSALAQSRTCGASGTTSTIQNQGDASALASACSTYSGSIAIATGTTGDIAFPGLERISGDFNVVGAQNVTTLGGDSLQQIDGEWNVENVVLLTGLNFPQLTDVGNITWQGLPNLATLTFTSQITTTGSFNLQNTFLSDLTGVNLTTCDNFYLANNGNLQDFTMNLKQVGYITLQSNGNRMNVTFPNLQSAVNITIRNVPSASMPSLQTVNGSLAFLENDMIESISLPKLTHVGTSFAVSDNQELKNLTVNALESVSGAVNVNRNPKVEEVTFPKLTTVYGAFNAQGGFTSITLPAVEDIRGAFNVSSTEDITKDCDTFKAEAGENSAIKGGEFNCVGSNPDATTASGTDGSGTSTGSGSAASSSSGAANPLNMPSMEITGVLGVFAAIMGML